MKKKNQGKNSLAKSLVSKAMIALAPIVINMITQKILGKNEKLMVENQKKTRKDVTHSVRKN